MSEENTSIVYALKPKPHRDGASAGANGYLAGVRSTGTYGNDDLIRDVAKATGQSEGLVRFIDTARREAIVAALKAGKRVYLDGVAFAVSVRGAFDTLDGGFDPKRNEVALTSYTYGGFHNCLDGIVPVNEVTGARPVLSVIREEGQEKEEILMLPMSLDGQEIRDVLESEIRALPSVKDVAAVGPYSHGFEFGAWNSMKVLNPQGDTLVVSKVSCEANTLRFINMIKK